jgi:hypothetical protein
MRKIIFNTLVLSLGIHFQIYSQCIYSALGADDHTQPSYYQAEYTDIALDPNGTPYIVYQDFYRNQKCTVKKHNGVSWVTVGAEGFSAGQAEHTRIAIDKNGTPYVVYQDLGTSGNATVQKFNGVSWVVVGSAGFSGSAASSTDIVIDSSGTPYVVYISSPLSKPTVQKYNGTSWVVVGTSGFSPGLASSTSISLDGSGSPYVLFQDGSLGASTAVVWKFNGVSWLNVAPSGGFMSQGESDLGVDSAGTPYVVCQGVSQICRVVKYDGTGWVNVGGSLSSGIANSNRIEIASDGLPVITFNDVNGVKVKKFNGTSWLTLGSFELGGSTSIALDSNDQPFLVYRSLKCKVLKYNGSNWTKLNTDGFSLADNESIDITTDSSGTPYVAFSNSYNASKCSVMSYSGSTWSNVGNFGIGGGTGYRIAIDYLGTPYIAYTESATYGYKASVMKFTGTNWVYVGVRGFSSEYAMDINIAIDNSGTPYVVYQESSNGDKISVMKFDGVNWVIVGAQSFSSGQTFFTDIAIDNNGTPYVVYEDAANLGKATVNKYDGVAWVNVGSQGFSVGQASYTGIEIDPNGVPYVVFQDYANGQKCTVMKFDGNGWVNIGNPGFTAGQADIPKLFINRLGTPYVLFGDFVNGNKGTIMKYNGVSWVYVGSQGFTAGEMKDRSVAISNTGNIYLAYSNEGVWAYNYEESDITVDNFSLCTGSNLTLNAFGSTAGYVWIGPNGFSSSVSSPTITNCQLINSGVYSVTISNANCTNTETINVIVDPTCQDVWPGDANSDGTADNLDVLELGLHYTQTGPPRASTSNSWQSYFANNWIGTITNGKNLNHSDCNGDGTINDDDTLAIYNNYGLAHAFKPVQTTTVNPQLSIVPDQATVVKGSWGSASIYLGDATTNINNINGAAFTVDFDNTLIETNSIYIDYQNSFLDAGQNLHFRKLDFSNGKIFTATTHTINNNASGYGKIATLHYQIKSSLTTDEILNIGLSHANQSNASGIIAPLTTGAGTLMALGSSVGLQELNGNVISISPNPTNGSLTINSKTELQKIEVVTITGQVLLIEVPTNVSNTLHLNSFANGFYFVNVYEKDRVVKREKIVLNK